MPDNIIKSFRYDFTEEEAHNLALELAEKTKELGVINAERTKANKKFTQRTNNVKARCNELSEKVSGGYEMRDIDCEVVYNKPTQGQKEITRTDTGEVLTETMTEEDWTLFNQA